MTATKSKPAMDVYDKRAFGPDKPRRLERLSPNATNKKFGAKSVTIGGLLGLTALTVIVASLLVMGESWYTLFAFEIVLIYICSEILVAQLPWSLASAMKRNCIRQDGSWSDKREQIELFALSKLGWDIRVILLLILVPTTLMVWTVDQKVVPLSIGFNALTSLRLDGEAANANLDDAKKSIKGFISDNALSGDPEQHKQMLRSYWPFALFGAMIWFMVSWLAIQKTYIYQLKELAADVHHRGISYIEYDRSKASDEWR